MTMIILMTLMTLLTLMTMTFHSRCAFLLKYISKCISQIFTRLFNLQPMHVKILAKGGFLEDTGGRRDGECGLHVRALPPCRPPPQEPAKDGMMLYDKDNDDSEP